MSGYSFSYIFAKLIETSIQSLPEKGRKWCDGLERQAHYMTLGGKVFYFFFIPHLTRRIYDEKET